MLFICILAASALQATTVDARKARHHRRPAMRVKFTEGDINMANDVLAGIDEYGVSISSALPITITTPPTISSHPASSCTPRSICVDGFTCSQRFGGCFDQNFCDGNTSSYPIPTCNSSPVYGLTAKNSDTTPETEDGDTDSTAEAIIEKLMGETGETTG